MSTRGFTLVELMATVAIVALLAAAAVPLGDLAVRRAQEAELRRALREIRAALDAHRQAAEDGRIERKAGESGYPRRLEALVEGVADASSERAARIYFLRRLPRDPFAAPGISAADTWGKRSYASPHEAPREGADVFDVYSLAAGTGLDGRAYRDW